MGEIIKVDKYETAIENGKIAYYAVFGKKKVRMPETYAEMYNDNYLAIEKRILKFPELFDTEAEHYIPLYTGQR